MISPNQPTRLDRYMKEWKREISMADNLQTLRTQYKVSNFVQWQRDGSLELNPNFQRRSVWKKGAKSYLIDTILRGFPIPIIFLREKRTDLKTLIAQRDVVDGQQRIRTVLSFIDKRLLPDFDAARDEFTINAAHNEDLAGFAFADLSPDDRQKILDYQFSVHEFRADTDDREILQIFARMNSTGMKANAQELRNAEFFGRFKTLAYQIATEQLNRWREWKIFTSDQIARMNEVELSSEFVLLIMNGILEKNNKTIDTFYEDYDDKFADSKEVARRFRGTFEAIEGLLSEDEIKNLFSTRTLFYPLFASIYGLQFELRDSATEYKKLVRAKPKPIKASIIDHMKKSALAISRNAVPAEVLTRHP